MPMLGFSTLTVSVGAATGAIHIAAIRPGVIRIVLNADGASVNVDLAVAEIVTVLTAAIDGALDGRTSLGP